MRLIGIGGEPATGKTQLMKAFMKVLGTGRPFTFNLVKGTLFASYPFADVHVLGLYPFGEVFQGTDKLSMGVQPDALALVHHLATLPGNQAVVFEGDRLFNGKFIDAVAKLPGVTASWLILQASPATKHARHQARGDTQGTTFLKARTTKYANLLARGDVAQATHETPQDTFQLNLQLVDFIRGNDQALSQSPTPVA